MPSPIAHAATGYALAELIPHTKTRSTWWGRLPRIAIFVFVALAADLDFIPELLTGVRFHHGPTHSIFFAAAFALLVAAYLVARRGWNYWAAFLLPFLLYGSHLLLDYFTAGGPGIRLLWPFSGTYYQSPLTIFPETYHSEPLLHWGHVAFFLFEVGYALAVVGLVWLRKLGRPGNVQNVDDGSGHASGEDRHLISARKVMEETEG
jgi:inner membrane protein